MNLKKYGKRSIVLNYRIFLSLRYFKIVILSIFFTAISTSSIYAEIVSVQQFDVAKQKLTNQNITKEILVKGRSQWQKGELENALLTLEEAVKLDPSNKQIAKVFKSMQLQKKRIDGLLRKAFDFIEKNDYQNAKKSLKRASFISDEYSKYKKVFQKFIETKEKVAEKVTNDRQEKTVSLFTSSKNSQVANDIGRPFVQLGHTLCLDSVAITPNGKYALSGSSDKTLKLWDLKTGKEIRTFKGHIYDGYILSIAITANGKYALSGLFTGAIKLWNLETGKTIRTFKGHAYATHSVAITPDGKYALSGGWDNTLKLWDLKTGEELRTFVGHTKYVNSVAITPDGKYALSGSDDEILMLWNLKTGKVIRTFKGHTGEVNFVAITPNGKYALSGSDDFTLKLWNLKTGEEIRTFEGHTDIVNSVAITPDGKYVLSGSRDDTLKLWSLKTGEEIRTFRGHTSGIGSVAITPNGKYALSGSSDNTLKLWNLKTGEEIRTFEGKVDLASSAAITPDGKYALSGLYSGTLKLWNLKTGKEIRTFEGHTEGVNSIAITPNGKYALSGSYDETLKLWNLKTGNEIRTFKGHKGYVLSAAITPDGRYALSGSGDKTLKLWNLKTGKEIRTFEGHTDTVESIAITPNGKYALSGGWDNTFKLWNLETGKEVRTFKGHTGWINSVAITPNGKYALSGSRDKTLKLWSLKTGKEIRTFEGHTDIVESVAITPDGKYALSSDNKTLKLWNLNTGKEIKTFEGHTGWINSISITPDGKYALSGSHDETQKLWNLKTGKELLTTISFTDGEWLSITPEGYFNASANGAKHLNVLTGPMSVTSVDAYYETFYRPDIVKAALAGKSIDTGLAMSDIKPAPEVEIIHTPSQIKSDEVKVTMSIKDIGGGVGDIRLYLNGVAVKTDSRPIVRKQSSKTIQKSYTLKLPKGKNSIKALVFNQSNTMQSNDALHTITANYKIIHKPEIHALVIGIDTYKNPKLQLKYAASDATLFADTIASQSKGLFSKTIIHKLDTKENTSKEAITQKLKELQSLNPDDLFVFYVASHGTVDDGEYFLVTSNVGSTSTRKLKSDAIKQADLKRLIANVPTTKKLIVLDTCNAGAMGSALLTRGMSEDTAMKILSRAVGSTILSAATSQQQALEGYKEHGLFTYVLTEGLKGKADSNNDGYVKTLELANYIDDEVPQLAEKLFNRAQYPVVSPSGQAFPVGKVK